MLKGIGRLRKQKRLLAVNRKQNFVVQFGGCTMSFGKGEFLSVEKVHKIKIAVARSVTAVRRLEVGCPVKEVFCDAYGIFQESKYTGWMLNVATL